MYVYIWRNIRDMEKSVLGIFSKMSTFWFLFLIFSTYALYCISFFTSDFPSFSISKKVSNFDTISTFDRESLEKCVGKYIYVHDLPREFNRGLVENCRSLSPWSDFCPYLSNMGFGPRVVAGNLSKGVFLRSRKRWFKTNQFSLEVIFHSRMQRYECLTDDSSRASAIFVPFYAGLNLGRHLWGFDASARDGLGMKLVKWLGERPEWRRNLGRDHFLVAGRIAWDFMRRTGDESGWGSMLMLLPESRNMTVLSIETSSGGGNEFAVPYPTFFHPSNDDEVSEWQKTVSSVKRPFLFSFAGAPRPASGDSIRREVIRQCEEASSCKLLECGSSGADCDEPAVVMGVFERSDFCLQPPGDSFTRRSTFDAILAGCIPVFFRPESGYNQYVWHFPKDPTKYSVLVPESDVKDRNVSIEETLRKFPRDRVLAMRREVIGMIPRILYSDPRSRFKIFEDAFDIAINNVLERMKKLSCEK